MSLATCGRVLPLVPHPRVESRTLFPHTVGPRAIPLGCLVISLSLAGRSITNQRWSQWDSNPRHQHCQRCALPTELWPQSAGVRSLYPASPSPRTLSLPRRGGDWRGSFAERCSRTNSTVEVASVYLPPALWLPAPAAIQGSISAKGGGGGPFPFQGLSPQKGYVTLLRGLGHSKSAGSNSISISVAFPVWMASRRAEAHRAASFARTAASAVVTVATATTAVASRVSRS